MFLLEYTEFFGCGSVTIPPRHKASQHFPLPLTSKHKYFYGNHPSPGPQCKNDVGPNAGFSFFSQEINLHGKCSLMPSSMRFGIELADLNRSLFFSVPMYVNGSTCCVLCVTLACVTFCLGSLIGWDLTMGSSLEVFRTTFKLFSISV